MLNGCMQQQPRRTQPGTQPPVGHGGTTDTHACAPKGSSEERRAQKSHKLNQTSTHVRTACVQHVSARTCHAGCAVSATKRPVPARTSGLWVRTTRFRFPGTRFGVQGARGRPVGCTEKEAAG